MNYLVFLDAGAGELEKILSGVKSMVIKEVGTPKNTGHSVNPGDTLYFLRNNDERALQVKATVKRIQLVSSTMASDISHQIKEMQTKLQLTEEQYNYWSKKEQVLLVEFECAQKIGVIHLSLEAIKDQSDWIAFEEFSVHMVRIFQ